MSNQAVHAERSTTSRLDVASRELFTQALGLLVDDEPGLRTELQSLVLEHTDQRGGSTAPKTIEELLRERCESRAGLDINENDMLTRLTRELLILMFSSVNWGSLVEKLAEEGDRDSIYGTNDRAS
jgi:hypothetical protein